MIKSASHPRIKKLRPRKSLRGEPSNSKCKGVNSNGAQLQVWEVEVETSWVAVRLVIPPYPSGLRLLPLSGRSLPNLRLYAPPLLRAVG